MLPRPRKRFGQHFLTDRHYLGRIVAAQQEQVADAERGRSHQLALQRDAQGAYVLVVGQDGKVARKNVVTERLDSGDWIVGSGLARGDRVIVSGLQRAQPGQPAKATPVSPGSVKPAAAASAPIKG